MDKQNSANGMSLRQIGRELGVTAAYLSMCINGKRKWPQELHRRYLQIVNSVNRPSMHHADASHGVHVNAGAGEGDRTLGHLLGRQMLYH